MLGAQTATCRLPSSPGLCPKSWRETERYDHVHCDVLFVVLQMVLIIELLPTQAILSVVSATHPLNGVLPYGWWFSHGIYFHIFHELSHSQKLKPWNFCCPCAKQTNHISIFLLGTIYLAANRGVSMSVPLMAIAEAKITNHTVDQCRWDYRSALEGCSTAMYYVAKW